LKEKVFVVDDEEDILNLVSLHLKRAGYQVKEFKEAGSFLQEIEKERPALVVLDLMLPDMDGIEVCRLLKSDSKYGDIYVLMLTALSSETDVVLGLELGADDYVTKPFSPRELVARVKAVLRRGKGESEAHTVEIKGILKLDFEGYRVWVKGKEIELTATEFRILKILIEKKGRVLSREKILDYLWGNEKYVIERTVDVHIRHLREKLGEAGCFIKNVRGVGYRFEA